MRPRRTRGFTAVAPKRTHLLERDFLRRLDPGRGRFRSYLLRSLEHFLVNQRERETALKRGGAYRLIPLDLVLAERELPAAPEPALWAPGLPGT